MNEEQLLEEIEKLPPSARFQLSLEVAKYISDLRWLLNTHPDQDMVKASCLHYLGDAAQEWYENQKDEIDS